MQDSGDSGTRGAAENCGQHRRAEDAPKIPSLENFGGRYVTLSGSNPWFHLPQDRWPHAVDAAGAARLALTLTAGAERFSR